MSDEYARKYMGGARIRFLDKAHLPRWMHGVFALGVGAGVLGAALEGSWAPVIAIVPTALASWAVMTTIRISVTDAHVHVQYGLWGPKVALEDIVDVDVIEYSPAKFGGWGIRFGLTGERAYSMPGKGGKAVRLRYRTARGERTAVITSVQPDALRAAIDEARSARTRSLDDTRAALGVEPAARSDTDTQSIGHAEAVEAERTR